MNRENLVGYLSDPGLLDQSSLPEVEKLVEAFPYFQTAHILLARNHHNLDSLEFHEALRSAAAFAGDRTVLYNLIHFREEDTKGEPEEEKTSVDGALDPPEKDVSTGPDALSVGDGVPEPAASEPVAEKDSTESVELAGSVDRMGTDGGKEDPAIMSLDALDDKLQEAPGSQEYRLEEYTFTGWFDHIPESMEGQSQEGGSPVGASNQLIDQFLEAQPRIKPDPEAKQDPTDRSEAFGKAGDSLMTETLAKIYVQQGKYKKAIYAYEKLSLKYPEKSTYFATQINRIKKSLEENR
jgi:hypothetical protein